MSTLCGLSDRFLDLTAVPGRSFSSNCAGIPLPCEGYPLSTPSCDPLHRLAPAGREYPVTSEVVASCGQAGIFPGPTG